MRRLILSAFYSALMTLYGTSIYYLVGLALTLSKGGDTKEFLWNTFSGAVMCFFLFTFVFWELGGAFERANQRRRDDDRERKDGDKTDPPSGRA